MRRDPRLLQNIGWDLWNRQQHQSIVWGQEEWIEVGPKKNVGYCKSKSCQCGCYQTKGQEYSNLLGFVNSVVDPTKKVSALPLEKCVMLLVERTTSKQNVLGRGEKTNLTNLDFIIKLGNVDKCGHFGKRVNYVECDHGNNSNDNEMEDLNEQVQSLFYHWGRTSYWYFNWGLKLTHILFIWYCLMWYR